LKCSRWDHHVRDCPQCRAGEAESLLKDFRERKVKKKDEVRRLNRPAVKKQLPQVKMMDTGEKSGCLKVKLEGSVETEALLDSGADCLLISFFSSIFFPHSHVIGFVLYVL
jgi:hypothetical protein